LQRRSVGRGRYWYGYWYSFAAVITDQTCRRSQIFGMMMTIHTVEHLDAHAEKAGCFPLVDAGLHKPRRRRVPQGVRRDRSLQASETHCRLERSLDRPNGKSSPLHEVFFRDAPLVPPPHVCKQARRDWHGWLTFPRLPPALRQTIVDAVLEVDERSAFTPARGGCGNRRGTRARVEPNEDEAGQVSQWSPVGLDGLALVRPSMQGCAQSELTVGATKPYTRYTVVTL
jgi:hypothetical protein